VPRSEDRHADVSEHLADHAVMALAPDAPGMRRLALKAGRKESVRTVARRYRVKASQVALWNGVSAGTRFRPGQTVIVYVAAKSSKARKSVSHKTAKARKSTRRSGHAVARKKTPVAVARN